MKYFYFFIFSLSSLVLSSVAEEDSLIPHNNTTTPPPPQTQIPKLKIEEIPSFNEELKETNLEEENVSTTQTQIQTESGKPDLLLPNQEILINPQPYEEIFTKKIRSRARQIKKRNND